MSSKGACQTELVEVSQLTLKKSFDKLDNYELLFRQPLFYFKNI
ncbi:hypothetical protein JoomaDRAFT_3138 [Galbibacter orientalis DSM 19592]|uniref:Uncharacterized protein n=1 Tax=Galbibacter orientalis DSM 19592 TaxID=926559 RepID=I3C8Z7_9FLAO|nr:hypothetical protein JoomaDRAFT_3138 [Galbibacter orientalis DSM 19592]